MTTHNFNSPVQVQAKRRRFDRYVLDLDRGSLLFDGNEIALRPKTFAVLHYLVDNCGRLVSKDELFAAVWPNIAVTDDVLVQSIGELRRALGDDGARLIRTIPRRGYRFESDVSVVDSDPSRAEATPVSDASGELAPPTTTPATERRPTIFFRAAAHGRGRIGVLVALASVVLLGGG